MDLKPRHLNHKYLKGHFSISSFRSYVFYRKPSRLKHWISNLGQEGRAISLLHVTHIRFTKSNACQWHCNILFIQPNIWDVWKRLFYVQLYKRAFTLFVIVCSWFYSSWIEYSYFYKHTGIQIWVISS